MVSPGKDAPAGLSERLGPSPTQQGCARCKVREPEIEEIAPSVVGFLDTARRPADCAEAGAFVNQAWSPESNYADGQTRSQYRVTSKWAARQSAV